jgi:hypothetical protein
MTPNLFWYQDCSHFGDTESVTHIHWNKLHEFHKILSEEPITCQAYEGKYLWREKKLRKCDWLLAQQTAPCNGGGGSCRWNKLKS